MRLSAGHPCGISGACRCYLHTIRHKKKVTCATIGTASRLSTTAVESERHNHLFCSLDRRTHLRTRIKSKNSRASAKHQEKGRSDNYHVLPHRGAAVLLFPFHRAPKGRFVRQVVITNQAGAESSVSPTPPALSRYSVKIRALTEPRLMTCRERSASGSELAANVYCGVCLAVL
ncbi:hypothetical protein HDK77DRAFT_220286 [Phyllosticta capitalensis]